MLAPIPRLVLLLSTLLCIASTHGVEIRRYEAGQHDRFVGTPADPQRNPEQLFSHLDTSGIGWLVERPDIQVALVSRQHLVFATHYAAVLDGRVVCFLGTEGQRVERTVIERKMIREGGEGTDLTLLTLDRPIEASEGVHPLPILDLDSVADYEGRTIGVAGQGPVTNGVQVIARDDLDQVENDPRYLYAGPSLGLLNTRFLRFRFPIPEGSSDEGFFEGGDSGSPTFVDCGGCAALVGVHSYTQQLDLYGSSNDRYENYDVFVPHYAGQLDAEMARLGYRMRRMDAPATALGAHARALQDLPRRGEPLTVEWGLANTGVASAGNVEIELEFPAGQQPQVVAGIGWVTSGGGSHWVLRRTGIEPGEAPVLHAFWDRAPAVDAIAPTVTWRSDVTTDESLASVVAIAPSFADWAAGLPAPGQDEDPDGDGMANLLEYAFGGDPATAGHRDQEGRLLLPRFEADGATARLEFWEREDKELRGLSYRLEYSADLATWTAETPAGVTSFIDPAVPERPGFVRRVHTGPTDAASRLFVRVAVSLDE